MSEPSASRNAARLWLFDFDNTIAALEREVDWAASRRQLERFLREAGVDDALFTQYPSRNLPLYNALLMRMLVAADDREVERLMRPASRIIEAFELRGAERALPLPGAIALLGALHARGDTLAIVTSNSSLTVSLWLARKRMATRVAAIVGRDSLLPLKPSPASIVRALELCGIPAAQAMVVGDSEADLRAAHDAEVGFYGIAPGPDARHRFNEIGGAAAIFPTPAALASYLGLV